MNISIEFSFRNHDKAQFLEALFEVADIWYLRRVTVTIMRAKRRARVVSEWASKCRTAYQLWWLRHALMDITIRKNKFCEKVTETMYSRKAHVDLRLPFRQTTSND